MSPASTILLIFRCDAPFIFLFSIKLLSRSLPRAKRRVAITSAFLSLLIMYYVVYGLLYAVSLLPLRILYLFSDFTYFLLYYVFGYRKKVVMGNLMQAFPEKTDEERKKIAKQFYLNFTDNFIEVIKLISASPSFINKHFTGDYTLCNKLYEEGRKCHFLPTGIYTTRKSCFKYCATARQASSQLKS